MALYFKKGRAIAQSNLVAGWHLNGDLLDFSGNGRTLNQSGTVNDYAKGPLGRCKDFAGGYMYHSWANFSSTQEFSILIWMNMNATGQKGLVSRQDGSTRNYELSTRDGGSNTAYIFFSNRSAGADVNGIRKINMGQWHLISVSRKNASSGTNEIYIDGVLDKQQTGCGNNGAPSSNTVVGATSTGGSSVTNQFPGKLAEPIFFDRALTADEHKQFYKATVGYFMPLVV